MMWMFSLFYVVSCLFSWFFKSPGILYLFWELWSTLNSTLTDPSSSCTKCLLKTTPPPLGYPLVPGGVRREFQNLISGVWCSTIKFQKHQKPKPSQKQSFKSNLWGARYLCCCAMSYWGYCPEGWRLYQILFVPNCCKLINQHFLLQKLLIQTFH